MGKSANSTILEELSHNIHDFRATALCYCLSPDTSASSSPRVRLLDLERPIIDFTLDADNRVWVFLDPNWNSIETSPSEAAVELLTWVNGEVRPLFSSLRRAQSMLIGVLSSH